MRKDWWVPLIGVAFVVVAIVSFGIQGEPVEAKEGAAKVVEHYVDNDSAIMIGAALQAFAASLLVFFAGYLRKVFRAAEGEGGMLSALILIGGTIMATGIAIDATIGFALADLADDIDPTAAQALQALWDNDFLPMALGLQVFLLALGLSVILYGGLPKWLGYVAILLAIVAVTPIGFAAFIGSAVLVLIISVLLTMANRRAATV